MQQHIVACRGCTTTICADTHLYEMQGMSDDDMSVQQFRQRCVDPMGEESDHVHIVALTNALQARPCSVDRSLATVLSRFERKGASSAGSGQNQELRHHDMMRRVIAYFAALMWEAAPGVCETV